MGVWNRRCINTASFNGYCTTFHIVQGSFSRSRIGVKGGARCLSRQNNQAGGVLENASCQEDSNTVVVGVGSSYVSHIAGLKHSGGSLQSCTGLNQLSECCSRQLHGQVQDAVCLYAAVLADVPIKAAFEK